MRHKRWNGEVLIPLGDVRTEAVAAAGHYFSPAVAVFVPLVRLGKFRGLYVGCDVQDDTSYIIKLHEALFFYEDGKLYAKEAAQCHIAGHLKISFSFNIALLFAIVESSPRFALVAEELVITGRVTPRREVWIGYQEHLMKFVLLATAVALGWNFLIHRFPGK